MYITYIYIYIYIYLYIYVYIYFEVRLLTPCRKLARVRLKSPTLYLPCTPCNLSDMLNGLLDQVTRKFNHH